MHSRESMFLHFVRMEKTLRHFVFYANNQKFVKIGVFNSNPISFSDIFAHPFLTNFSICDSLDMNLVPICAFIISIFPIPIGKNIGEYMIRISFLLSKCLCLYQLVLHLIRIQYHFSMAKLFTCFCGTNILKIISQRNAD